MKFSLGISPCPNDTFIFDALINQKIDTGGITFDVFLEDVQTLNEWVLNGKLQFSKISYGVWPLVQEHYRLLESGGAMGMGVGPLLIAHHPISDLSANIGRMNVAIPGKNTTAHFLFSSAFPQAKHKTFMVFHEIEAAVLTGKVDAGVIIHENRFTYREKGLIQLADLGALWEERTGLPIPLGGIVAHRSVDEAVAATVDSLIRKSVEYAFARYPQLSDFVKCHAQEMNESIMRQHIDLYVNAFTLHMGTLGKQAIDAMTKIYATMHEV